MTPDDLRELLDDERAGNLRRGATDLTLADRVDVDDERDGLFGGLV